MSWDWNWLTPLGHVAVVWPLTIATAALLISRHDEGGSLRGASTWLVSMAIASALVAASKVAFYGWGTGVRAWNLTCFSGHSVLAMGFWPVALALLVPRRQARLRLVAWMVGILIGVLVGLSRLELGAHPLSEVIAGLALGLLVALLSIRALAEARLSTKKAALAAALTVMISVTSEIRLPNLPTEHWLASLGASIAGNEKPVQRHSWPKHEAVGRNPD